MRFEDFALAHGLVIKRVDYGKWCRTTTTDKPHHKNGSFKHLGDVAFVQNHATMNEPAVWFPEGESDIKVDGKAIAEMRKKAERQAAENREKAAKKAAFIIGKSALEQHSYLDSKGFPKATGLVYRPDESTNLLVIPMRVGRQVVGCQLVDIYGVKKFLFGQRCTGAEFVMGNGDGVVFWLEGYATGLSVMESMAAIGKRCTVHVCFSAWNMQTMASEAKTGFVIADNDESGAGERSAKETGLKFFLPPTVGHDFNDYWKAVGTFSASQALRRFIQQK